MSSTRDEQPIPDLEAVGKAYREAGFDDEPPAHVDAFIRATAKRDSKRKLNDYLPSLAMAATIVLALGLVLRLTVPGRDLLEPAEAPEAEEAAAPRVQEPEAFQEQAAPLEDNAAPAEVTAPVADDAAQLEEVVAPARASATATEDGATASVAPAAADLPEREGVASTAIGRMAVPAPASAPCTAPERDDPARWLACIAAQIDAGLLDDARAELEQFRRDFADYPVPANIAESLDP